MAFTLLALKSRSFAQVQLESESFFCFVGGTQPLCPDYSALSEDDIRAACLADAPAAAAAAAANAPVRTAFRAPLHSVCIIIIIFVAVILTDCSLCSLARLSPWLVFVHTG